ncbi:pyridoxal phosphate-dependent transferase [Suillus clintonianus]|uniref:pyridoxal phosphate-dependent transferase n=1 Tax=Suillus clintonianus TaxID=1904413 RepID=UPI001B87E32B|nr:pyridoxal phosphate-dependent transferase [Suillus clintonianus]KAG2153945.1 pyridoxal phosphate-dependent transferase [Suillus clintonianus]
MSHLYKHLRIHQVFGANTDVGKTIITTALVRASALNNNRVFYLKPVSTGAPQDADDGHIKRHAGPQKHLVDAHCLFRYGDPVSPHLAAKMASETQGVKVSVPSDETFVGSIAEHIRKRARAASLGAHMYVETAGGVHSPTLSGTTQLDSYRPLFLPTILIGDSKLGGISSTISSFESLLLRGYIIDAILLFRDEYYRNFEYLTQYFAERGIHVTALDPPPPRLDDPSENFANTEKYYSNLVPPSQQGDVFTALEHLNECHARRIQELDSMPRRTSDAIWWPFVQHGLVKTEKDVTVIDSAWSDFFSIYDASRERTSQPASLLQPQLDGSASWWTQAVGHGHPTLALAAANAAGRYGHVMFPQATHLPALKLAERLLQGPGKGWASRVFFSDNGSTGMEAALKMALRSFIVSSGLELSSAEKKNLGVIGLKGSYHGDTIGAMDACEEGVYACEWHEAKGYWFEPPTVSVRQGQVAVSLPPALSSLSGDQHQVAEAFETLSHVYDVEQRLESPLARHYRRYLEKHMRHLQADSSRKLAALVIEPIVMGAGGMIFVDPLFQRIMVDVVRDPTLFPTALPVIFDEVFVGLYRLGFESAGPLLGVSPDISVNAKILTGGVLPLAVTLASDRIFQAFNSESKVDALLHGHSYTAHAVGCQVANATLDMVGRLVESDQWLGAIRKWAPEGATSSRAWSFWDPKFIASISCLDIVDEAMTLGTVLAIKFKDDDAGYASHSAQTLLQSLRLPLEDGSSSAAPGGAPFGVHYRTLGNVAYFMSSLNTSRATIEALEERLWRLVSDVRRS